MEADKEDFWGKYAGADVWLWTYKDKDYVKVELEDLYQQFKARLMAELAVNAPDLSVMGALVDRPTSP